MAERYMRAYYWTFTPTGVDAIDAILEQIAKAGKAYHNTSEWGEPSEWGNESSPCYWALIEKAAHDAAKALSPSGDSGT